MRGPHEQPHDGKTPGGSVPPVSGSSGGSDVGLLEQLAEFSKSAGEYGSALEYYEQILHIALKARESGSLVGQVFRQMASCRSHTGDYSGALGLLDRALGLTPETGAGIEYGRIQNERAWALLNLGRYDEAEDALRSARDRILDRDVAAELAKAQKTLGVIAMRRGDWETANRALESALAGFRTIEDREGVAQCLTNLGLMEKNRGNHERARTHMKAALKIAEDVGDTYRVGLRLMNLGILEFKVGNWEVARENWERALRLAESIGDKSGTVTVSLGLGNYYLHKRDFEKAAAYYERADVIGRDLGEPREQVLTHEFRGDLCLANESYEEAREHYRAALEGGEKLAPKGDLVLEALRRLADLESSLGHYPEAEAHLGRAVLLSEAMEEDYERGILFRIRARMEAAHGDIATARDSYLESVRLHEVCGTAFDLAVTRLEYASFCMENIVDLADAARHLERARDAFERIGADYEAGHAYLLAAKLEMVCDHPTGEARHHLESAMALLERVGNAEDQEALAVVHRDIDRLLEETAASERNDLAALNEVVARVQAETDGAAKVRVLERALEERLNADRVALFLASGDEIAVAPASGLSRSESEAVESIVESLCGDMPLEPRPIVSTSPVRDPRFVADPDLVAGLGSAVFMPLFSEDDLLGGIYADLREEAGYFRQPELDFVVAFAPAAGLAVQDMRLDEVRKENRELRRQLARRSGCEGIVTQSRRMLDLLDVIERLGDSDATVLLQGETGTGKELLASAAHRVSTRANQPMVAVNCAALARDVLESELFGHVRGAFTDAKSDKIGLFEKADGGSIFLDEIDKTPVAFQERLLRAVDQGEIKPVGSSQVRQVDVRILCATNRPLKELVEQGKFLKDLYYRLRVIQIDIPPLRERKEDVPLLVDHFLEHFNSSMGRSVVGFTHEAMNALVAYPWPGNVRDLRHEVERAVAMAESGAMIGLAELSPDLREGVEARPAVRLASNQSLGELVESIERELVEKALKKTEGNRSWAARLLGISRRGLLNKIARYSIDL